eukprot:365203-Chlamydomonas_euryale.AAC.25
MATGMLVTQATMLPAMRAPRRCVAAAAGGEFTSAANGMKWRDDVVGSGKSPSKGEEIRGLLLLWSAASMVGCFDVRLVQCSVGSMFGWFNGRLLDARLPRWSAASMVVCFNGWLLQWSAASMAGCFDGRLHTCRLIVYACFVSHVLKSVLKSDACVRAVPQRSLHRPPHQRHQV